MTRARRRDAEHNRAQILNTAAQTFAHRGATVDVREIARQAGVGMGTLYRHFPTKQALVDAVLADARDAWADTTRNLLTSPDPFHALTRFMTDTLTRHSTHRGLLQSFTTCFSATPTDQDQYRTTIEPVITELITRARTTHQIRNDITAQDIALQLIGIGRIIEITEDTTPGTWHRHLDMTLRAMRP